MALVVAAFGVVGLALTPGCASDNAAGTLPALLETESTSYATIEPATTTTTTTIAQAEQPDQGAVSLTEQTYTIEADDTISGIATKFGISMDALIAHNGWVDGTDHLLLPGDRLEIPPNAAPVTDSFGGAGSDTPAASSEGCTYTIGRGDFPITVAEKFGISLDQLQIANPQIDFTTTFTVGDVVVIPPEGNC